MFREPTAWLALPLIPHRKAGSESRPALCFSSCIDHGQGFTGKSCRSYGNQFRSEIGLIACCGQRQSSPEKVRVLKFTITNIFFCEDKQVFNYFHMIRWNMFEITVQKDYYDIFVFVQCSVENYIILLNNIRLFSSVSFKLYINVEILGTSKCMTVIQNNDYC